MKFIVCAIASVIGAVVGYLFFEGAVAAYVSLLLSYHLCLIYFVVTTSKEKKLSMSVWLTMVNHLAFLVLLVGMAYSRAHIPYFGLIRFLVPGLAPFEAQWLFSGKGQPAAAVEEPRQQMAEATIDDHEDFREYMMQSNRAFRKPGISIPEEFNLWLADRQQKKAQIEALRAAVAAEEAAAPAEEAAAPANKGSLSILQ